jgi:hypothetical protein
MDDGQVRVPGLKISRMLACTYIKARITYSGVLRPGGQQTDKAQCGEKRVELFHIERFFYNHLRPAE